MAAASRLPVKTNAFYCGAGPSVRGCLPVLRFLFAHPMRLVLSGLLFMLALAPTWAGQPAGDTPPPPTPNERARQANMPSLVIVIYSPEQGPVQGAVAFSRRVPHRELQERISRLGRNRGWRVWGVKFTDEPGPEGNPQTSATFRGEGMVDRANGLLGLEPLIEEFGGEGIVRIAFLVPGLKNFRGPFSFVRDGIAVRFTPGDQTYEYEVIVPPTRVGADGKVEVPSLTRPSAASRAAPFLAIGICLSTAGVLIGWLRYGRKKKTP